MDSHNEDMDTRQHTLIIFYPENETRSKEVIPADNRHIKTAELVGGPHDPEKRLEILTDGSIKARCIDHIHAQVKSKSQAQMFSEGQHST